MNTAASSSTLPLQTAHRRRGLLFWLKRGLLVLVVLPILGFTYETVMAGGDAGRFVAPGQLVEVSGHTMHLNCVGEGSPTVVFEAGYGEYSDAWSLTQPEVGTLTRSCSYDRAGFGWSEASTEPRTQEQIAIELHELLAAADIQPPYILVGHSMAGKSMRLFTSRYPDEVSGLVFVDARHESVDPVSGPPDYLAGPAFESSLNLFRILRQVGLVRLFGTPLARMSDPSLNPVSDDVAYRIAIFQVRETTLQTEIAEGRESAVNNDELRSAILPDGLPVFVLTQDLALEPSLETAQAWETGQQNLVALSSNSQWLIVDGSSHSIQHDKPQVVIDAIRAVIEAAQTGDPLAQ